MDGASDHNGDKQDEEPVRWHASYGTPGKNNVSPRMTPESLKNAINDEDYARLKVEAIKAQLGEEKVQEFEFVQAVAGLSDLSGVYMAAEAMGLEPSQELATIIKACVVAVATKMNAFLKDGVDPEYLKLLKAELKREGRL